MWSEDETGLHSRFAISPFAEGLAFVNRVGQLAEEADHHPDLVLRYTEVQVHLISHDVGEVTKRDHDLAAQIEGLAKEFGVEDRTTSN